MAVINEGWAWTIGRAEHKCAHNHMLSRHITTHSLHTNTGLMWLVLARNTETKKSHRNKNKVELLVKLSRIHGKILGNLHQIYSNHLISIVGKSKAQWSCQNQRYKAVRRSRWASISQVDQANHRQRCKTRRSHWCRHCEYLRRSDEIQFAWKFSIADDQTSLLARRRWGIIVVRSRLDRCQVAAGEEHSHLGRQQHTWISRRSWISGTWSWRSWPGLWISVATLWRWVQDMQRRLHWTGHWSAERCHWAYQEQARGSSNYHDSVESIADWWNGTATLPLLGAILRRRWWAELSAVSKISWYGIGEFDWILNWIRFIMTTIQSFRAFHSTSRPTLCSPTW